MNFGNIWPFFLLAILIPFIILLYLLKQKTEDKMFSSLYLWKEAYRNLEAARPWEKFRNNLLMYLQIITVLALIIALAAPYLKSGGTSHRNMLLVIDTSASMNTKYDDGNTRLKQAIKEAEILVDSLPEGTAFTVLSSDQNTVIRGANVTDKIQVRRILSEIRSTDLPGDMEKAVAYASSIVSQWEDYEAVFFTDTQGEYGEVKGRAVNVNSQVTNACIDYVSLSQKDDEMVVLAKVTNASWEGSFSTDINLYVDEVLTDIRNVTLEAGESTVVYFEGLKPEGKVIKAEINEKDGLDRDNAGYVIRETDRELTALLVTGRNTFLETAVSLTEGVEFYKTNEAGSSWEEEFDLYVFDGVLPEVLPAKGSMVFIHPPTGIEGMFDREKELTNVMVSAVPHQVTRYAENASFGTVRAASFAAAPGYESILKAGEDMVGFCGEYQGRKAAVLGFDFHDTDFPLQTEFPILIHNLISWCLDQGMVRQSVYQAGDMLTLYPDPEAGAVKVQDPLGEEYELSGERYQNQTSLEYSGVYTLTQSLDDREETAYAVARFPTGKESFVTFWEGNEEGNGREGEAGDGGLDLRNLFLIAGILLLCGEWLLYVRSR